MLATRHRLIEFKVAPRSRPPFEGRNIAQARSLTPHDFLKSINKIGYHNHSNATAINRDLRPYAWPALSISINYAVPQA